MKKYMKLQNRTIILYVFLLVLSNIAAVAVQFLKGNVLDFAISSEQSNLVRSTIFLFAFIILEILFMQLVFRTENKIINYSEKLMRKDLFDSILQTEYSEFQGKPVGDYISKFTVMLPQLKSNYFSTTTLLLSFSVKIIMITAALIFLNWKVAALTLFLLTLPLYLPKILEKPLQRYQKLNTKKLETLITNITNIFQGFEVIKNFSVENIFRTKFKILNEDANKYSLKNSNYSALMRGLMSLISYFSYFAIIAVSAYFVFVNEFTAGQFFIAVGMIDQLSYPLIALAGCIQNLVSIKPLTVEYMEFISPSETREGISLTFLKGDIVIENASFSYGENTPRIFEDFSLIIDKGKKYLIQGESGCGKTTLINCLLKYYTLDKGAILIDNQSIKTIPNVNELFSIMRQDVFLFSDTIRNNLALYNDSIDDFLMISMLKQFGLDKYASAEGLDTRVGDGELQLSGGEKRRIGISRTLLAPKDIMIFDEPLANLDDETKEMIKDYILNIKDKTIIVVSHEWFEGDTQNIPVKFDKIVFMGKNKIDESALEQHTEKAL